MIDNSDSDQQAAPKIGRDRSPAYPFISLRVSVERLAQFEAAFGRHPAPAEKVGLAWKLKEKSSQAFQTLAALKAFGLVEYKGSGADRVAFLSEDGRNFLRAQQTTVKAEILKRCALRPKAIHTYWQIWGADRPIDPVCLDALVLKGGYTESAAATFLRVYDETIAFAGLPQSDSIDSSSEGDDEVFEDQSMQSVLAATLPIAQMAALPQSAEQPVAGSRRDVFSLDEGQVVLQWPEKLSADSYEDFESWIQLQLRKIKRSIL